MSLKSHTETVLEAVKSAGLLLLEYARGKKGGEKGTYSKVQPVA